VSARAAPRLAALAAGLWLAACGDVAPTPAARPARDASRTVRDTTGAQVRLPAEVRRIVTTVPGLTETVLAMGLGTALVGVSDQDPSVGVVGALPRIAVWPTIPPEAVAALAPDLVLVDRTLSAGDLAALRRRFPGTFATDSRSLDGLRESFLRVAEAVGHDRRGQRLAIELDRARREARVEGRPKVLLLGQGDPPIALGPGSLLDDMVRAVGGENVAFDLGRPSGELSPELVRARAPEWILRTGGTFPDALRERWSTVPAVERGRVVDLSGAEFVQAGPRTAGALLRLARILSGTEPVR
jgi:ABC-type Fe3+-hydroxamate transport system substrate-binding protein